MAPPTLVEADIARGSAVIAALKEAGLRPRVAFWRYFPESSEWRLMIALPASGSPPDVQTSYEELQHILRQQHIDIPIWRISVVSGRDPVSAWARNLAKKTVGVGVRSSTSLVNDSLVEDTYIYPMKP